MLKFSSCFVVCVLLNVSSGTYAQDYSVEPIEAAPDAEEVSAELRTVLMEQGLRVKRGSSRTACEIWLVKNLNVDTKFKSTPERLYPFSPGQLIGLLHFSRRGKDFRDQSIDSGWYTLRFGLQPVDGNHVGTSPTRDFVVLVGASQDAPDRKWDAKQLMTVSAEAAGSSHPAMLCLQKASEGATPAMRHDESHDWWILHCVTSGTAGDSASPVPIDLIVVGHATE